MANAQLTAAAPANEGRAQTAFTNPGGLSADLVPRPDGRVTYDQLFSIQPFGNRLVVRTFSDSPILALLRQQFDSATNTAASPLVRTNSFLATGSDKFTRLNDGTAALGGHRDVEALQTYVVAYQLLTIPATG